MAAALLWGAAIPAGAQTVSTEDAATQLMDLGEKLFPALFPKHRNNQKLDSYFYRYYPDTGLYLGVSGTGIYVLGGQWPAITYVAEVRDYLTPVKSTGVLSTIKVPAYPHEVIVMRPAGATRAMVFLHGGAGRNSGIASGLDFSSSSFVTTDSSNWMWLLSNKTMVLFPQGQAIASAPFSSTWSNHAMVSGEDDVAFLKSLANHVKTSYGVTDITLGGHSMGGAMTNRMWCEAPTTFSAYFSIAGPASSHYLEAQSPCTPGTSPPPFFGIFAGQDRVMQNGGKWEAATWTIDPDVANTSAFVNPVMIGEWQQYVRRAQWMCGQTPKISDKVSNGVWDTWTNCGGKLKLVDVLQADHEISSIQGAVGQPLINLMSDFLVDKQP